MALLAVGAIGPARAQGLAQCSVGEQVAASYGGKWLHSVVVAVDPGNVYPCRVHPLGYLDTMNTSWAPSMLRPLSEVNAPLGGLQSDPWLAKMQGRQPFKATAILHGSYECYALSGGRLSPRLALNFQVTGPGRYTDWGGKSGTFQFDPGSGGILFHGAALDGQRATYEQPTNPPSRNEPPRVTFAVSGDSCDLKL